jgi:hypothetical protein
MHDFYKKCKCRYKFSQFLIGRQKLLATYYPLPFLPCWVTWHVVKIYDSNSDLPMNRNNSLDHAFFWCYLYSIEYSLSSTRLSRTRSLCSTRFWKAKFFIPPSKNCFKIIPYFCLILHWIAHKMVQSRTLDHKLLKFTEKSGWRQLWAKRIVWTTLLISWRQFIVTLSTTRSLCSTRLSRGKFFIPITAYSRGNTVS